MLPHGPIFSMKRYNPDRELLIRSSDRCPAADQRILSREIPKGYLKTDLNPGLLDYRIAPQEHVGRIFDDGTISTASEGRLEREPQS